MAFGAIGAGLASSFAAKARQKDAAAAQLHLFKRRHQFETEDLEKAGLNRILGFARGSAPGVSAVGAPAVNFPAPDLLGVPKKIAVSKHAEKAEKAHATTAYLGSVAARSHVEKAQYDAWKSGEEAMISTAHRFMAEDERTILHSKVLREVQRNMTEGKFEASGLGRGLRKWFYGSNLGVGPVKVNVGGLFTGRKPKFGKIRHGNEPLRKGIVPPRKSYNKWTE